MTTKFLIYMYLRILRSFSNYWDIQFWQRNTELKGCSNNCYSHSNSATFVMIPSFGVLAMHRRCFLRHTRRAASHWAEQITAPGRRPDSGHHRPEVWRALTPRPAPASCAVSSIIIYYHLLTTMIIIGKLSRNSKLFSTLNKPYLYGLGGDVSCTWCSVGSTRTRRQMALSCSRSSISSKRRAKACSCRTASLILTLTLPCSDYAHWRHNRMHPSM